MSFRRPAPRYQAGRHQPEISGARSTEGVVSCQAFEVIDYHDSGYVGIRYESKARRVAKGAVLISNRMRAALVWILVVALVLTLLTSVFSVFQ